MVFISCKMIESSFTPVFSFIVGFYDLALAQQVAQSKDTQLSGGLETPDCLCKQDVTVCVRCVSLWMTAWPSAQCILGFKSLLPWKGLNRQQINEWMNDVSPCLWFPTGNLALKWYKSKPVNETLSYWSECKQILYTNILRNPLLDIFYPRYHLCGAYLGSKSELWNA